MIITATGAHMVKNSLTFMGDQKLGGKDLSFVNMLFILKIDTNFISGILLAKTFNPSSVRLDVFTDCIKLKLFIFEYDLLKPNLSSGASVLGSTLSSLLDGRTKVKAVASQPLYHLGSGV